MGVGEESGESGERLIRAAAERGQEGREDALSPRTAPGPVAAPHFAVDDRRVEQLRQQQDSLARLLGPGMSPAMSSRLSKAPTRPSTGSSPLLTPSASCLQLAGRRMESEVRGALVDSRGTECASKNGVVCACWQHHSVI